MRRTASAVVAAFDHRRPHGAGATAPIDLPQPRGVEESLVDRIDDGVEELAEIDALLVWELLATDRHRCGAGRRPDGRARARKRHHGRRQGGGAQSKSSHDRTLRVRPSPPCDAKWTGTMRLLREWARASAVPAQKNSPDERG